MTCRDYELLVGDAVGGSLDDASQRTLDAHLAGCPACRQLAEDFRVIRAVSRDLEPPLPSPQVWTRIAAAVESTPRRRRFFGVLAWQYVAATAAIALAVGWTAWRDFASLPATPVAVVATADADPVKAAEDQYAQAISGLEEITKTSSAQLGKETADVLQANLSVIDNAIGESRAALQQEPASELAQESLFEALRHKVVLLQDAVALINEMRKGDEQGAARIVSGINQ